MDTAMETAPVDGAYKVDTSRGEMRGELSSQWFSRPDDQKYLSLEALIAAKKAEYDSSRAEVFNSRDLEVYAPSEINSVADTRDLRIIDPEGNDYNPTHWSFGQACSLVGAPAAYLRKLPSQLAASNLGYGLIGHRKEMVKTYVRENGTRELRAITGPDYGRIPDYEVAEAVQALGGDWKVPGVMDWSTHQYNPHVPVTKDTTTLFASDRDIFLFLVDDTHPIQVGTLQDGSPDLMFRGFYVTQSEVGAKSLIVACMYLRGICANRCLWGVEGFETVTMRHSKLAPDRFMQEINPALASFATGDSQTLLAGVEEAKSAQVASDEEDALAFLRKQSFNAKQALSIVRRFEEEEQRGTPKSVWDMAQGITAVARDITHQDSRVDFEKIAGKMLDKVAA